MCAYVKEGLVRGLVHMFSDTEHVGGLERTIKYVCKHQTYATRCAKFGVYVSCASHKQISEYITTQVSRHPP